MKKIKLLMPLMAIPTLSTVLVPLTSCHDKDDDETTHISTEHETPVVGNDFVIKFKLDDGYSLGMSESTIEFADSNAVIGLNRCVVNPDTKTITVPGNLVTSTSVKLNIVSVKPEQMTGAQIADAIKYVLSDYDNKNISLGGQVSGVVQEGGKFIGAVSMVNEIKMYNHDIQYKQTILSSNEEPTDEIMQYQKADDFGWWAVRETTQGSKTYTADIEAGYRARSLIDGLAYVSLETLLANLKYDAVLDAYKHTHSFVMGTETLVSTSYFSFNHNKELKTIIVDDTVSGIQKYAHSTYVYSVKDKGGSQFNRFTPTTYETVATADKFDDNFTTTNLSSEKLISPVLTGFDKTKETYIYFPKNTINSAVDCATLLYNGDKLLTPMATESGEGDYYFYYSSSATTSSIYVKIKPNVLDITKNLKFAYGFFYAVCGQEENPYIQITQPTEA